MKCASYMLHQRLLRNCFSNLQKHIKLVLLDAYTFSKAILFWKFRREYKSLRLLVDNMNTLISQREKFREAHLQAVKLSQRKLIIPRRLSENHTTHDERLKPLVKFVSKAKQWIEDKRIDSTVGSFPHALNSIEVGPYLHPMAKKHFYCDLTDQSVPRLQLIQAPSLAKAKPRKGI